MRKKRLKLTAKIPNFMSDSLTWRKAIYAALSEAQRREGVEYSATDKLEVEIRFHLQGRKLTILDLDNRLKDVGDALQAFIYDKGAGGLKPIIPNDNQIYRLVAEKRLPSKSDREALSTITIRRYSGDARTVADPRETRKHVL